MPAFENNPTEYTLSGPQVALARLSLLDQAEAHELEKPNAPNPYIKLEFNIQDQVAETDPRSSSVTIALTEKQRKLLVNSLPVSADQVESATNRVILTASGMDEAFDITNMDKANRDEIREVKKSYMLELMRESNILRSVLLGKA